VKKYLVSPGFVFSQRDGDRHWIGADRLMHLYGVDPRECVIDGPGRHADNLIVLVPRFDGNYSLRAEAQPGEEGP
jgi:hypothetical protein